MMYDRALLKVRAEEEARKKFVFKKKSGSRSVFAHTEKVPKREKMSAESREKEVRLCSLELQSLTVQIAHKHRAIAHANSSSQFDLCAKLHKEYRALLVDKQNVQNKLTHLQKREGRHLKYITGKARMAREHKKEVVGRVPDASKVDIRTFLTVRSEAQVADNEDSNESEETRKFEFEDRSGKDIGGNEEPLAACAEMGVPGTNKETEKKRKLVSENSNSEKVGVAGNKHFLSFRSPIQTLVCLGLMS